MQETRWPLPPSEPAAVEDGSSNDGDTAPTGGGMGSAGHQQPSPALGLYDIDVSTPERVSNVLRGEDIDENEGIGSFKEGGRKQSLVIRFKIRRPEGGTQHTNTSETGHAGEPRRAAKPNAVVRAIRRKSSMMQAALASRVSNAFGLGDADEWERDSSDWEEEQRIEKEVKRHSQRAGKRLISGMRTPPRSAARVPTPLMTPQVV